LEKEKLGDEVLVLLFTAKEASLGAKHAEEKYPDICLDRVLLRETADKIIKRMHEGENPKKFADVRYNVLWDMGIRQWTGDRFKAWKSALGKMFGERNAEEKSRSKKRKLRIPTTPIIPVTEEENGQLAWGFWENHAVQQ